MVPLELVESSGPELSLLGKRIELLRIDRGLSKQVLARRAGTSRQQLWRVMTGKSELTGSLCLRLADVLQTDSRALRDPTITVSTGSSGFPAIAAPGTLAVYLEDPDHLVRTLATLPARDGGREVKLDLLASVERRAQEKGLAVPAVVAELRNRVLLGEL